MAAREIMTHQIADLPPSFAPDLRVWPRALDKFGIPHVFRLGQMVDTALSTDCQHTVVSMPFQSGDPRQGWNGGTTLAYLASIHYFLLCCQDTQFACPENKHAIDFISSAIDILKARIIRRAAEGTFQTHQGDAPKPAVEG